MNSKIALSGLSIFAALSLIGGAAFAFFSSTGTSTGNVFGSGTLTLQLDDLDETTPAATVSASLGGSNLAPGATVSGFISMHNGGTITIAEVNLDSTETAGDSPDLATKLNITSAKVGTESTCTITPTDVITSLPATLAALNADVDGVDLPGTSLAAGADKFLCLTLTLDSGTDNTFQGKSITETFTLIGHQDLSQ